MNRLFLLFGIIFVCIVISSCKKKKVQFSQTFNLTSTHSNFEYEIKVLQIEGNGPEAMFFVLDPKDLMPIIQTQIKKISPAYRLTFVGIGYPKGNSRERDFTISERQNGTGMGPQFLKFIRGQLDSTLISKNIYNSSAKRGIIGHSLGGLFSSYCFSHANTFFNNYIILSPALFYDDYRFFEMEKEVRSTTLPNSTKIFLGVGKAEDMGMNNSYEALRALLHTEYSSVELKSEINKGSHYESRHPNLFSGLKYILE